MIIEAAKFAGVPESKASKMMEFMRPRMAQNEAHTQKEPETTRVSSVPPEQRADELRSKLSKRVGKLSKTTGEEYKSINLRYIQTVCSVSQKDMTVKQLEDKLKWIEQQIMYAR